MFAHIRPLSFYFREGSSLCARVTLTGKISCLFRGALFYLVSLDTRLQKGDEQPTPGNYPTTYCVFWMEWTLVMQETLLYHRRCRSWMCLKSTALDQGRFCSQILLKNGRAVLPPLHLRPVPIYWFNLYCHARNGLDCSLGLEPRNFCIKSDGLPISIMWTWSWPFRVRNIDYWWSFNCYLTVFFECWKYSIDALWQRGEWKIQDETFKNCRKLCCRIFFVLGHIGNRKEEEEEKRPKCDVISAWMRIDNCGPL